MPALTHLNVAYMGLDPINIAAALKNLAAQCPAIIAVDIHSKFQPVPLKVVLGLLEECGQLRRLTICVAYTIFSYFTPLVVHHTQSLLTHLECSGLTDATLLIIAGACPMLTHVNIAGCNVRDASVLARPRLQFICLDNTRVADATLLALAKCATSLKTAWLRLSDDVRPSALAFAVLLASPTLRTLKFSKTFFTIRLQRAVDKARWKNTRVELYGCAGYIHTL